MDKRGNAIFQYIIEDLQDSLQYLTIGIAIGILVLVSAMLINHFLEKKVKLLPAFLMGVYLTCLAHLVFFNREVGSRDGIALQLFETVGNGVRGDSYVVENILLFVPFGIFLPWLCSNRRNELIRVVLIGGLGSVLIEMIQFITKCGYCQLDDIIMNTFGTLIGYVCYHLFCAYGIRK